MRYIADEIREYINRRYFKPARKNGIKRVELVSGDVLRDMKLGNRMPNVCQVLRGKKLQNMYNVRLIDEVLRSGVKKDSSTNRFIFYILSP